MFGLSAVDAIVEVMSFYGVVANCTPEVSKKTAKFGTKQGWLRPSNRIYVSGNVGGLSRLHLCLPIPWCRHVTANLRSFADITFIFNLYSLQFIFS